MHHTLAAHNPLVASDQRVRLFQLDLRWLKLKLQYRFHRKSCLFVIEVSPFVESHENLSLAHNAS